VPLIERLRADRAVSLAARLAVPPVGALAVTGTVVA
jgi:hypothetical protein